MINQILHVNVMYFALWNGFLNFRMECEILFARSRVRNVIRGPNGCISMRVCDFQFTQNIKNTKELQIVKVSHYIAADNTNNCTTE